MRDATAIRGDICGEVRSRGKDSAAAEVAGQQHGVVDLDDLRRCGWSRDQIAYARKLGRLVLLYPRVYAVGHSALCREGRWLAAVKAIGSDARLSHSAATAHCGIRPRSTLGPK